MILKLVDMYEGYRQLIGYVTSINDAKKLIRQRIADTDGECEVWTFEWDQSKLKFVNAKLIKV